MCFSSPVKLLIYLAEGELFQERFDVRSLQQGIVGGVEGTSFNNPDVLFEIRLRSESVVSV